MTELEQMIKEASQKYYSDGTSDLTDVQFDEALERLRRENPNSELLTAVGHGYDEKLDTSGQRVNHRYGPIFGLEKAHNYKELYDCLKHGDDISASIKLDGLSIVLYYEHNKMVQAVTRGGSTGLSGIDVTDKINKIFDYMNISSDIGYEYNGEDFTGAIRGEVLMTNNNFEKFIADHEDVEVKNPRNAAAGILNRKEISEDLKYLTVVVYSVVAYENSKDFFSFNPNVMWLHDNCEIPVVQTLYSVNIDNEEYFDNVQAADLLRKLKSFIDFDYPYDGLVFTHSWSYDRETCEIKWMQQAFKFPSEIKATTVKGVEWSMTKTHRCVPRINIEETKLAGTSVNYCTGNNAKFILDNRIGTGALISITKSGEIIPQVVDVLMPSSISWDELTPDVCPYCNHTLTMKGVDLVCENPECLNANIQDLLAYVNAISPMENFGDKLFLKCISKFVNDSSELTVDWLIDALEENPNRFHMITNSSQGRMFNEKMNGLVFNNVSLSKAVEGLNIPRIGEITSKKIERECPELVAKLMSYSLGQYYEDDLWIEVSNKIGVANAASIKNNVEKFKRLRYIWDRIADNGVETKGKVAITGRLSVKRSDFEKELADYGYQVTSSITKDTNYLITDTPDSNTDKNKKADKFGITKLTESEFRSKFMH